MISSLFRSAALAALIPAAGLAQTAPATPSATESPAATPAYDFAAAKRDALTYGPRPFYLIDRLPAGALKDKLNACRGQAPKVSSSRSATAARR